MGVSCSGPVLCNCLWKYTMMGLTVQAQRDMNAVDESFLVASFHRLALFIFYKRYYLPSLRVALC